MVEQVRAYYRRPWAEGDSESVVRTFLCECGDTGCSESAEVTVERAAKAVYGEHVIVSHGEPVHDRAAPEKALEKRPWAG